MSEMEKSEQTSTSTQQKVVVLTVKSQKASGEKVFRLHKKRVVLGSATSSDVRLDDASVSPVHAILEVSGIDGKPVIYDLASETGLSVNGTATVQASLNAGDQVTIGPYLIGVKIQEFSEAAQSTEHVKEAFGQKLFVSEKEDIASLLLEDEREVIDIFDYRPEAKLSLQVVMFYGETILEVEHFVDRKRVVIGPGTREDFSIPPFLGEGKQGRFELVTNERGQYMLQLHDAMEGVLSQKGNVVPVREVMSSMASGSTKVYPLGDKDFAKVQLGDVSFFLNFTPAPPRLKSRKFFERDVFFAKVWATSLMFTTAALVGISTAEVDPSIEIEQLPERVATIIYEPKNLPVVRPPQPKPKPEPTKAAEVKPPEPKPIKPVKVEVTPKQPDKPAPKDAVIADKKEEPRKVTQAKPPRKLPTRAMREVGKPGGQEGEGARAQGVEGRRGRQNVNRSGPPQTAARRPGPGNPNRVARGNTGHSQTNDLGVVDVFKSNKGTLSKLLAGGKGLSNAADKLEGYSGFTTRGAGGLGAAGTGSGGGGQSQGLGGLSDKGAGGGRKGTGLGALGSGGNMLGGKGTLTIDGGGGRLEPIVLGSIDTDAIARAIAAARDQIKYCYEKEINADNPDMAGRVGVRFVIGASGTVSTAAISSTSLKNANTERCVIEVIKRIQFPPVRGGGIAEVTYPFVFKPSDK